MRSDKTNDWRLCGLAIALLLAGCLANLFAAEKSSEKPSETSKEPKETWWSLKPLKKSEVPAAPKGKYQNWARTPIDQFVLSKLTEKSFHPSPPADKHSLLRRVYFDLIGLPPTPEEMEAFLKDKSPDAYSKVVDRLLASPRYGERWARHWLDVVHYADTHGNDQDRPRANAWPYRDYLIRSFNEDKPYARFVQEQLAGDILFPDDPQGIIATGFIAAGPWDESSQVFIVEDTVDKKIARNLDRDDMVMTTMSTFVSSTVHCARCHNHKFDPIPQTEYYGLQAVFAGVDRADRPYDTDPKTHVLRQSLLKKKRALEAKQSAPAHPLQKEELAELGQAQETLRKTLDADAAIWTALDPASFTSAEGATLTKLPDSSLLASGKRPDKDTYTVTAHTDLKGITGIRVEVLTDPSLPHNGPGRQDNGNLHLSEFQVKAASRTNAAITKTVLLQNPTADFNQQDWDVAKSVDNNPSTAWGIFPEIGHSHQAVFETKEPIVNDGGTILTFTVDQVHGRNHLIGRLRISVTTAPLPVRADRFPYEVVKSFSTPEGERSEKQKAELLALYHRYPIDQQLVSLPPPQMVYAAASDFTPRGNFTPSKVPRPIYLLKRGDVSKPADEISPGALSCVPDISAQFQLANPNDEGSRRAALAKWITDPKNVLTWRSIVNRIWHYHFGRGIVDSPNDFGHMGGLPSHPELLDWLAVSFLESGGSIKKLHQMILNSAVYLQSTQDNPEFAKVDSGNLYLWRMNRIRLDAESVRDAVLQITGKLDLKMGGLSAMQFKFDDPNPGVTPMVDYGKFDVDSPESCRRSVYRYLFRSIPDPFMDTLDCADASQLTASRNLSLTALQAMAMMNDRFIVRQSEHFAERVGQGDKNLTQQIQAAYQLTLGRSPTASELRDVKAYATKHGMANTCRVILNSNEFMFVN
ncbi:MAG: Protein of unknown function (DUF1553)/Protein of unknown function (DUF1549)/Planctomycete [Pedosphaera sp.]|nr:Protein of unknown function (DUF1553)/Protein of unknown function (DUF1549)/Planctomycete [Pedosphaera sp.]